MKSRADSARRLLKVQRHLAEIAELRYMKKARDVEVRRVNERALLDTLSSDNEMRGMFADVTAKRIVSLQQEANALQKDADQLKQAYVGETTRLKAAQRLSDDLAQDERLARERADLDTLIEATLAARSASLKQGR